MEPDLTQLLAEVRAGELTSDEFRERLEQIHGYHLGEEADAPERVAQRNKAYKAFDALTRETASRHHELELVAEALGIDANPG